MYKVEEIFKILSLENKALKSPRVYKVGKEGILRAFYFFRWCNKKDFETLDDVVEAISKGKIPEQPMEHFLTAIVFYSHMETNPKVMKALEYVKDNVEKRTGKAITDNFPSPKIERRTLKNIHKVLLDSLDNLKDRAKSVSLGTRNTYIIAVILVILGVLGFCGLYFTDLLKINLPMENSKVIVSVAFLVLMIVVAGVVFVKNQWKIKEYKEKSAKYESEIGKLEETLQNFQEMLEKKKIRAPK